MGEYYYESQPDNLTFLNMLCLVKGHELAQNRENEDELGSKIQELKFGDLKDDPLGSVPSILFWNDQQRQIYTRVTSMKHTLLMGDYGTGLYILLTTAAFIEYLSTLRQDPDPGGRSQDTVREGGH